MATERRELVDGTNVQYGKQNIDAEKLRRHLPNGANYQVTEAILAKIKNIEEDAGVLQEYAEEKILSHMGVLKDTKVSVDVYVDATKYCILIMSGMNNSKAWEICFPEKAAEIRGRNDGKLNTSWSAQYNRSKIVTKLMTAMYIPINLTHQPLNAWAVNKQYELAQGIGAKPGDFVSATVQQNAATSLYEMTKTPEDNSLELKIGLTDEAQSVQKQFMQQLRENTKATLLRLEQGESLHDVQDTGLSIEAVVNE